MADDQLIDAEMASSLYADAIWQYPMVAWVVMRDAPDYPGKFVARLVTRLPSRYVIVADTLVEIHAALPPGLVRYDRQPANPPEVIELWFADA